MDGTGKKPVTELEMGLRQPGVGLHKSRGVVLLLLILGDMCSLLLTFAALSLISDSPFLDGPGALALLGLWGFLLSRDGLYHRRRVLTSEVRALALVCLTCHLALGMAWLLGARPWPLVPLFMVGPLTLVALVGTRIILRPLLFYLGPWRKRVALVGGGETSRHLEWTLSRDKFLGFEVVGYVDTGRGEAPLCPRLGELEELPRLILNHHIEDLILVDGGGHRERLDNLLSQCEPNLESVRVVADLVGLPTGGAAVERVGGQLLLQWNQALQKPWNRAIKRGFDLVAGFVFSLLALPVVGLAAAVVVLTSPGGAFFWQERLGQRGRRFFCIKLRTMYADADTRMEQYLRLHPEAREEWEHFAKLKGEDPRVTPVGRWLRRFSIDELPQLWHVLAGEMSLVGPRPYLPRECEQAGDRLRVVLVALPGLTGLWQVSGRNHLSFGERLQLDAYYVRHWTLGMDLVILLRTGYVVLSQHGAY